MTLKEKLARSRVVNDLSLELSIYNEAIAGNSKFKTFYQGKADEIKAKIKALIGEQLARLKVSKLYSYMYMKVQPYLVTGVMVP